MSDNAFSIGSNVLIRCTSQAEEIVVPQGIKVIGESAFRRANLVQKIVLPEGVREIRARAFCGRKTLRTVVLPASLEIIGEGAFSGCEQLSSVVFTPVASAPDQGDQDPAEAGKQISIGEEAFSGCRNLQKLELPDSVTFIGEYAFRDCGFREFRLPRGITVLDAHVFTGRLKTLVLHEDLRDIHSLLFSVTRARFPAHMTRLPFDLRHHIASRWCILEAPGVSLRRIPDELKDAALKGLAEWEYRGNQPNSACETNAVRYVQDHFLEVRKMAMENQALLAFLLRRNLVPWRHAEVMMEQARAKGAVEETVMLLEYLRQFQTPEVEEQRMTEMLQELETGFLSAIAFDALWESGRSNHRGLVLTRYLGSAREVSLPAGREKKRVGGIARELFSGNREIQEVQIPEGIQRLAPGCFAGCASLRTVSLPSTLTEIPEDCFAGCGALQNVYLASGPRVIRRGAFRGCISLTDLRIPKSVEIVESEAFACCEYLEAVLLPAHAQARRNLLREGRN